MKTLGRIPVLLLVAAFLLAGAKTPIYFCLWSLMVLAFAAVVICKKPSVARLSLSLVLFSAGVFLSQTYSLDPANSQFWTTQLLVYACLWFVMPGLASQESSEDYWDVLRALGTVTVLVTGYQWVRNEALYGMLPLNPNINAVWMGVLAAAMISKPQQRIFDKALTLCLVVLVILGPSRSGLLAFVTGAVYAASHRDSDKRLLWCLGLAGLVAILVPHQWFNSRLYLLDNSGRMRIWDIALRSLADAPLTGSGAGNFDLTFQHYAFPFEEAVRYGRVKAFAHNDYLQTASELGWPLAGLLCLNFYWLLRRRIDSRESLEIPAKTILMSLAVAAFFNPIFKMPIFAYLALLSASYLLGQKPSKKKIPAMNPFVVKTMSLFIFGLIALSSIWCGVRSYWATIQKWDHIVARNRWDGEAWHELAYQSQDLRTAVYDHSMAVQMSPRQPIYVEALARTLENGRDPRFLPQAVAMYLTAIDLAPSRAINQLSVARILWRANEPENALAWVEKARRLEPNYWECELWQARCFEKLGDEKRAIFTLKNLLQRREQFIRFHPAPPQSPYEQTILGFDASVVQKELRRLGDAHANTVE